MITKIISGGQTGADQGGLYAAKELGIETGGCMPKGFRTQRGPNPKLAQEFNLVEHFSTSYSSRTRLNIINSDATVIFGDCISKGSMLTIKLCLRFSKPFYTIEWNVRNKYTFPSKPFQKWIIDYNVKILNVAGNREEINPGIFYAVKSFLVLALQK